MFDFDAVIGRCGTGSSKWNRYAPDVLPMWVADMDFAVAPCIVQALRERLEHPVFGYAVAEETLRANIVEEMHAAHGWRVEADEIVFLPGVEPGFNMALKALLRPGDTVAVQTPIYPPILQAPFHWGLQRRDLPLSWSADGACLFDPDAMRAGVDGAQALLLCNPHNPTGKVFTEAELRAMAEACLASGTLIISDEIHADLVYDGRRHIPIASLGEDVARRTITLMAASKTYNIAGLKTAFAIIRDPQMRQTFNAARLGMVDSVNALGLVATSAAYAKGKSWKQALLGYLQANRDYLANAVAERLPGVGLLKPQGTFLAWLDCTAAQLTPSPQAFFLERAKVGLNPGADFGPGYDAFVRLNFGCPRSVLESGLTRLQNALEAR